MTPRPGRIAAVVPVELPRPRSLASMDEAAVSRTARRIRELLGEDAATLGRAWWQPHELAHGPARRRGPRRVPRCVAAGGGPRRPPAVDPSAAPARRGALRRSVRRWDDPAAPRDHPPGDRARVRGRGRAGARGRLSDGALAVRRATALALHRRGPGGPDPRPRAAARHLVRARPAQQGRHLRADRVLPGRRLDDGRDPDGRSAPDRARAQPARDAAAAAVDVEVPSACRRSSAGSAWASRCR